MKPTCLALLVPFFLFPSLNANAAGSMLRVACEGDDVGAEVMINGKFRGECPIDLQVPAGPLKLLVRKDVDNQREQVFEQDIRMGEGSVKKVEAHLGAAKLNAGEEVRRAENLRRLQGMPLEALQKEAAAGNAEAMLKLGRIYWTGPDATSKTEGLGGTWLRKAAEAGNVEAMYVFSVFAMSRHDGTPDDPVQMKSWALKAAEAGNVDAMMSLARRYERGAALPKNDAEALRWYRRAAELGNTLAMIEIGSLYYGGKGGLPQDDVESVTWFRKAADAGDKVAMYRLGRFYAKGEGVATSEEQAIYWWRKAVEGQHPIKEAVEELKKRGLL